MISPAYSNHPEGHAYGLSVHLDIYGCDRYLDDRDRIEEWALGMVQVLGMEQYGSPELVHFGHGDPKTAGWSVKQWIQTSSIVAHFSPYLASVHADVFSCKPFDPDRALVYTTLHFGAPPDLATGTVLYR